MATRFSAIDKRDCSFCQQETYTENSAEPELIDVREQVMNPYTAYQITSMMEGVVQRGTGKKLQIVGKPVAGKTGTSNEESDAWFIGYTPDLAVGVYVGYDNPKPMGKGRTGGELAAPIVADFMRLALREQPATPFRVPRASSSFRSMPRPGSGIFGDEGVILEAFKPGEEPPTRPRSSVRIWLPSQASPSMAQASNSCRPPIANSPWTKAG